MSIKTLLNNYLAKSEFRNLFNEIFVDGVGFVLFRNNVLKYIYVRPEMRNRGYAKLLLESSLKERRRVKMFVNVSYPKTIDYLESRLGFKTIEIVKFAEKNKTLYKMVYKK